MKFERMHVEDVDEVIKIENICFKDPWPYHFFVDDILKNEFSRYFVLKENDEIIGYSGYWLSFENCDLVNIALKNAYQGKGLGQKLLNLTIKIKKEDSGKLHFLPRKNYLLGKNKYFFNLGIFLIER